MMDTLRSSFYSTCLVVLIMKMNPPNDAIINKILFNKATFTEVFPDLGEMALDKYLSSVQITENNE